MEDLHAAIAEIKKWPADRKGDRDNVVQALNQASESLKQAIEVWKDVQGSPANAPEGEMATMNMVGSDRSKKLHQMGLDTIASKRAIFKLVGGAVEYYSGLQDSLVVDAYPQLKSGETVQDRASSAIETMQKRIDELQELAKQAAA